ncbi:MAG: hypothetical protein ACOY42_12120 [Pseudomonadota bacterium]
MKQNLTLVTPLARAAISCGTCFDAEHLARAGIAMAQPFSIGANYQPGGVAVVGINPGAAKDGGCEEARKRTLERFAADDDTALTDYWAALATDAERFWNPRYLARLRRLGLAVDRIAVGNIALCATANNKYPTWMLRNCWSRHSMPMIEVLRPGTVVLMGGASVMRYFALDLTATNRGYQIIRMAHFAHRKGHAYENAECERVRVLLRQAS